MSDLRKAAEMALDALHNIDQSNNYDAIEALRQALVQPKWVGLTDNEVEQIGEHYSQDRLVTIEEAIRHVESVLKEKNA